MNPSTRFTVEVAAHDEVSTEVLTRQLRIDLRALGPLSLEPVFASMPVSPDDDPLLPPVRSGSASHLGVIAATGALSDAAVKNLFELLVAFVNRTRVGTVTVRRGEDAVTVAGASHEDASRELTELENLLG